MHDLSKIEITEIVLLSVHILVSLIMIFISKKQCPNNKLVPIAWLVSLVVVIVVLSLVLMS